MLQAVLLLCPNKTRLPSGLAPAALMLAGLNYMHVRLFQKETMTKGNYQIVFYIRKGQVFPTP